jgi:hypothetical protein
MFAEVLALSLIVLNDRFYKAVVLLWFVEGAIIT